MQVVREVGKYPPDAFAFVQEGLTFTVANLHGELTEPQQTLHEFMTQNQLDFEQLLSLYQNEQLPEPIQELISRAGGLETFNRHVSGQSLCWGLRDFAVKRWGALARVVLHHWNIRRTQDFGEIVFALVENDFLQKQSHDDKEDFQDVFPFEEAFDRAYHIDLHFSN